MDHEALTRIASRVNELFEAAADSNTSHATTATRTIQLRLVEPLLAALGWELTATMVEPRWPNDTDDPFEYALFVDDQPEVAVDIVTSTVTIDGSHAEEFVSRLASVGLNWGILTNGRQFVFLAADDDGWAHRHCSGAELPEHVGTLAPYTRAQTVERARQRTDTAAALRTKRDQLVSDIADQLEGVTETKDDIFEQVAAEAVDNAIAHFEQPTQGRFSAGNTAASESSQKATDRNQQPSHNDQSKTLREAETTEPAPQDTDTTGSDTSVAGPDTAAPGASTNATPAAPQPENSTEPPTTEPGDAAPSAVKSDQDSQYIVRFFGGSTTVGAVGNPSPGGALFAACAYLTEHRALTNRLDVPWGPDEETTVIDREPIQAADSDHLSVQELGAYYIWTGAPESVCHQSIETLADRCGLRVMFQGDWSDAGP